METAAAAPERSDSFLERLPDLLKSHEVQNFFRMTKQGLFVDEQALPLLYDAYQRWLSTASGGPETRTLEKCKKRFFGPDDPQLFYALDGNRTLAGHLIRDDIAEPRRIRIPQYQANLLDTRDSLHHRDPFLTQIEKVKTRLTSQEGFVIEVTTHARKFELSEEALREFASVLRASPRLLARFPDAKKALRYVLDPLRRLLEQAHPLPPGSAILVPERLKQPAGLLMFRAHGLTFAVRDERKICGCFSTKGKNLSRFIRRELESLESKRGPEPVIRGLVFESQKKHCISKTWSQGISFHLQFRTLILFLQQTERSAKLRKKLPAQFSVKDLLGRFVSLFRNSKPIDERSLLQFIGRRREALAKYRRTGNWLFVIIDKNVIQSCLALKGSDAEEPEQNSAPERAPGQPGQPRPSRPSGADGGRRRRHRRGGGGGSKHRGTRPGHEKAPPK